MRGAIEWDKARGYRMPYRVRDPLYAAIDARLGHPAAQSADKLRIGLDEIARLVNQSGAIPKGELRSILSALNVEGAK